MEGKTKGKSPLLWPGHVCHLQVARPITLRTWWQPLSGKMATSPAAHYENESDFARRKGRHVFRQNLCTRAYSIGEFEVGRLPSVCLSNKETKKFFPKSTQNGMSKAKKKKKKIRKLMRTGADG